MEYVRINRRKRKRRRKNGTRLLYVYKKAGVVTSDKDQNILKKARNNKEQ